MKHVQGGHHVQQEAGCLPDKELRILYRSLYLPVHPNRGKLFLDNCQAVGLSKTYCADKLITDSGAGGTAIASGQKTNYHYVGVDTLGHPLKSLVDFAAAKGKSTGIAVTCRLWDATPADFCCHNKETIFVLIQQINSFQ